MIGPFSPGLLQRLPEPPEKVVLLRASRIGDFILASPAIRALRGALPDAEFTFIGLPFVNDLAARSPHLDHFMAFPGFPGMADQFFEARQALRFFEEMQAREFDLAVQMHGSGVFSNTFTLMLGARYTAGFVRPGDPPGRLDAALAMPQNGHEIDRVLQLATFLGAPACGRETEFPLWEEDLRFACELLDGCEQPLLGLHPAAREATKRWEPERFAAVGAALRERHGGTLVVLGGRDERALADVVVEAAGPPCLNLAGQTGLGSLGAVVAQLAVLVTNDSAPAHVAYALGTPAVTVFGGTDPARWGPPTEAHFRAVTNPVPCWPCDHWVCPVGYGCLQGIAVSEVQAAAEAVMDAVQSAPVFTLHPCSVTD